MTRLKEAVELAFQHQNDAPVGVTAQLFAAIARGEPVSLLDETDRAKWQAEFSRMETWVKQKYESSPNDPALLFASCGI